MIEFWRDKSCPDCHPCGPDGRGGGSRHIRRLHGLVDRPDLCAITDAERLGEGSAVVGIDGRAVSGTTDHDIDGACVDSVGAERFEVHQDPIARRPLAGVNGLHPSRPEMPVGEVGEVEHFAPSVLALADRAGSGGGDRDHLGALPL